MSSLQRLAPARLLAMKLAGWSLAWQAVSLLSAGLMLALALTLAVKLALALTQAAKLTLTPAVLLQSSPVS